MTRPWFAEVPGNLKTVFYSLDEAGCKSFNDVRFMSDSAILKLPNIGKARLKLLREWLA